MGPGTGLELGEEVPDVRFDRFFGEKQHLSDLTVDETLGDELKHLDLTRCRLLFEFSQRSIEWNDLCALPRPARRGCVEPPRMIRVAAQDLVALDSVHGVPIGVNR